ncbi:hypothetical protein L4D21_24965, partial [Photobacterium profundum]|uniref:hypothetical protein n=1 Tax=Photobacterium profundum TaxID=74109 RepID=UPI003D1256A3
MDRHSEMTHEELLKVLELELKKLHTKDKRKAMLYWHYLNKKISPMNLTIGVQPVSPEETSIQIENIIRNYRGNVQNKIDIVKYIESSCSQSFLEDQQLNWIDKKDSRLIYFLFL